VRSCDKVIKVFHDASVRHVCSISRTPLHNRLSKHTVFLACQAIGGSDSQCACTCIITVEMLEIVVVVVVVVVVLVVVVVM